MLQLLKSKISELHQINDELYSDIRILIRNHEHNQNAFTEARKLERQMDDNRIRIDTYLEIINLL